MKSLLFIFLSFFFSAFIFAHPPEKIGISAGLVDRRVDIIVEHPVEDPNAHYIKHIEVFLNGQKIIAQDFSVQIGDIQHVTYIIPGIKRGDVLEVAADCSFGGDLHNRIRVE